MWDSGGGKVFICFLMRTRNNNVQSLSEPLNKVLFFPHFCTLIPTISNAPGVPQKHPFFIISPKQWPRIMPKPVVQARTVFPFTGTWCHENMQWPASLAPVASKIKDWERSLQWHFQARWEFFSFCNIWSGIPQSHSISDLKWLHC